MIKSKIPWAALAAVGLLVLESSGAASAEAAIRIKNFTFDPPLLTVQVGSKVTWKNEDDIVHVVEEKDGAFRSDVLDTDGTFSRTFDRAGTVDYFCVLHPHMTGKIVVKP
jgi:plastocyanin